MKVKLTPVISYLVEIEGNELGRFDKVSEWEGMTKITSPKGTIVFNNNNSSEFDNIFGKIFGQEEDNSKIFEIVKVSPDLIPLDKSRIAPDSPPSFKESVKCFTKT
jgi:hypothetical protein